MQWTGMKVEPSTYEMYLKKDISSDVEKTISVSLRAERKKNHRT